MFGRSRFENRACLAVVAVGVSADREAPQDLGTSNRSNAHGRHGGRPLQKRRYAKHIPRTSRIGLSGGPASEARAHAQPPYSNEPIISGKPSSFAGSH